jgi:hypothetical protein
LRSEKTPTKTPTHRRSRESKLNPFMSEAIKIPQ